MMICWSRPTEKHPKDYMCKDALGVEGKQVNKNLEGAGRGRELTGWKHPDHVQPVYGSPGQGHGGVLYPQRSPTSPLETDQVCLYVCCLQALSRKDLWEGWLQTDGFQNRVLAQ